MAAWRWFAFWRVWLHATSGSMVLLVFAQGCSTEPAPRPRVPIRIAIADALADGVVDTRSVESRLEAGDRSAHPHFSGGWYAPRSHGSRKAPGPVRFWSRGPAAVVEVQLAEVADLEITLEISGQRSLRYFPFQTLTALWNGEVLDEYTAGIDPVPFVLDVPAAKQSLGLNRLVLLSHYWGDESWDARGYDETARGFWIESIDFGDAPRTLRAATAEVVADGLDIRQEAGSVATTYAVLPEAARLRGGFDSGDSGARGRIVVARDGEPALTLFDSAPPSTMSPPSVNGSTGLAPEKGADPNAPVRFDLDLSAWSGEPAGLSFVVTGAAGRWMDPLLSGEAPAVTAVEFGPAVEAVEGARRPNILIVLFDTLRADATEPYGAAPGRTPQIARLASEGTTFSNAFALAATTRVSVASLLTGLSPPRHAVEHSGSVLGGELAYLPELLEDHGYTTIAVVNNPQIAADRGFDRGFGTFEEIFRYGEPQLREDHPDPRERARWTWETLVAPVLAERGDEPFFVYLHEIDPHFPYEPLPPYDALGDAGYLGTPLAEPRRLDSPVWSRLTQVLRDMRILNRNGPWLDPASKRALRARYEGEVAYMDAYLGWILDHLEASGLRRNTVVVFVSDHGEEMMEHGQFGHGRHLYDPALRVPLIVSLPGVQNEPAVVDAPVDLSDLAPTLARLAGAMIPDAMQGSDLFADNGSGLVDGAVRPIFSRGDWYFVGGRKLGRGSRRQASIRVGDAKLIRTRHRNDYGVFNTYELFDTARDPGETINLWFTRPVLGHTLRQRLEAREVEDAKVTASMTRQSVPVDAETRKRLRALGYGD